MRNVVIGATAVVLAAQIASARAPDARVDQLRRARETVARNADQTKGGPRHLYLQEQRRIESLIDDLEKGRRVDPAEIDRALERANRQTP